MHLLALKPTYNDTDLEIGFNIKQIDEFYEIFTKEFIDQTLIVQGRKVKIAPVNSKIQEFGKYNESFVHVITRDTSHGRIYTAARANRIHWIKPILENSSSKLIFYYKWKDDKGVCKEHFWFFKKDFMVVLKPVSSDLMIVTAFCVDSNEKNKFFERYKDFEDGNKTC
jgi:hypothetical protein